MNQHYILKGQFSDLSFADKVKKTYFGWCKYLLSIYIDKKIYKSLKDDYLYFKNYLNIPEILFYISISLLFISNIVLFPFYALLIKLYWKYRYFKILKNSNTPNTDMIIFDQTNNHLSGSKVLKILSENTTAETRYYRVLLENKEIHSISKDKILFEQDLINKKNKLEKELLKVNYSLELFTKKITYEDK